MTDSPDRVADVVTLMWNHDDGTVTTVTTDYTTTPHTVITRVWNDVDVNTLTALETNSVVIPDRVSL